ncbi:unnamed protein product, partial [Choristocarpus tenellus]
DGDGQDANFAKAFVGDEVCRLICDVLCRNTSKTNIFLDRNCIGADGAAALANMLKVNRTVRTLSLEWNGIGTSLQGVESLARALQVNCSLTSLVLCNNKITAQGAYVLAQALRGNCTLKELDLRWNEIGNSGARALRDSLDVNIAISTIKLSGNKV